MPYAFFGLDYVPDSNTTSGVGAVEGPEVIDLTGCDERYGDERYGEEYNNIIDLTLDDD